MAFKKKSKESAVSESPAEFFRTLTQRALPDVMPHQKEVLKKYGDSFLTAPDVALQLPTGSGKTLVGLLIAEWRRRKFGERVVYLCPTRQLVHQTVNQAHNQYGIDVVGLAGSKRKFSADAKAAFQTGQKVAVTTHSSVFNTSPFFTSPDVIIIDDSHAAENYIAGFWSLEIRANEPTHAALHAALSTLLRDYISAHDHARLTGDWRDVADATWVDKL